MIEKNLNYLFIIFFQKNKIKYKYSKKTDKRKEINYK